MWIPKADCTGCGACAARCPKDAISMEKDKEGFLYPQTDPMLCVDCDLCRRVCPSLQGVVCHETPVAVAAKHKDDAVRQKSSSGGVFTGLAQRILDRGGVICAAVYDENFAVVHKIGAEIAPFCGAKYAQSYAGHLFPALQSLLKEGKQVLFVGTPCQCAGLSRYLGKTPENLVLVDMICHGVPSREVWKAYLFSHAQRPMGTVNMRSKSSGWSHYGYSVEIHSRETYTCPQNRDPYMRGFTANLFLRPSCSKCNFKGLERCTDMTLGDFWGIWDLLPEFDDNKGTSLLLIHSEKGRALWDEIQNEFDHHPFDPQQAISSNPSAEISSPPHPKRDEFFERLWHEHFDKLVWDCLEPKPQKTSLLRRALGRIRRGRK